MQRCSFLKSVTSVKIVVLYGYIYSEQVFLLSIGLP